MFEGLVSELLTRFLGKYIKDLNAKDLSLSIWSGSVVLKNLEIKGEALEELNLPVFVKRGILGRLELQVPWKNLGSKPVIAVVEDLYAICCAQDKVVYDKASADAKALASKKAMLAQHELVRNMKKQGAEQKENDGFVSKLIDKVVDNIQVKIKRIHVRYEGESEIDPGRTYAFGATLEGIAAVSTDENWQPKFLEGLTGKLRNKLADLSSLAVYVDVNAPMLSGLPTDALVKKMCEMIARSGSGTVATDQEEGSGKTAPVLPMKGSYVLHPLSAQLKVILNMSAIIDVNVPKIQADLSLPDLSLTLSEDQFHTTMELLNSIGKYSQAMKYIEYRPRAPVKECPRAWFRYAACVLRRDAHERLRRVDFGYVMERKDQRERYVSLYKRTQGPIG